MGWWKFDTCKQDSKGNDIELNDDDIQHIVELIEQDYTEGEVLDGDEEE